METKQEIFRRYFRENDSIRKISRDLQISRKTVKKQLLLHTNAEQSATTEGNSNPLQDFMCSPPRYNSQNRGKRKLTIEVEQVILQQLEENQRKRQKGMRKQVKRKIDIHAYLLSLGFRIGYTTVCNYIREKELRRQEAYIRQEYIPGEECEFDWAEVKLTIGGSKKRLYMAVFTSAYSNYRFSILFNRQDTLAFMEAHNVFFEHIGGVYHEMVYDNMRVAIREFAGRNEKNPTQALLNLSGWYQFRWRFCNVRRGNEKGHVERSVEYVRRRAFAFKDDFDTLENAQVHLRDVCININALAGSNGKVPGEGLEQERLNLWKYPGTMECYIAQELKVDKYATVCFGTNRYSVPDYLCGRMAEVKAYANQLKMYYANGLVCCHTRDYRKHQWIITLDHYLKTLSRKPGALHGSLALTQAPAQVRRVYEKWFINHPRDFIELLQFCQNYQIAHQQLMDAADYVDGICSGNVNGEKIMAVLGNRPGSQNTVTSSDLPDEIESYSNLQLEEISQLAGIEVEEVL
jgi:transposase